MKNKESWGKDLLTLQSVIDVERGDLYIGESNKHIPFDIKRFYVISGVPKKKSLRGMHAHKEIHQAIFSLKGTFTLHIDNGHKKWEVILDKPSHGILIKNKIWHYMTNFSKDCVILVVASDYYREDDYVRNYEDFLRMI